MREVLARHHQLQVTCAQLGTLAGFTPTGGTSGTYFSTLKRNGQLAESNGELQISEAGLATLGTPVPPPPQTTEELLAQWRSALRVGETRMLDVLVAAYSDALTCDELGRQAGFEIGGGTFGTYLGTLRRNGLVEVNGDEVRASSTLFLGRCGGCNGVAAPAPRCGEGEAALGAVGGGIGRHNQRS